MSTDGVKELRSVQEEIRNTGREHDQAWVSCAGTTHHTTVERASQVFNKVENLHTTSCIAALRSGIMIDEVGSCRRHCDSRVWEDVGLSPNVVNFLSSFHRVKCWEQNTTDDTWRELELWLFR